MRKLFKIACLISFVILVYSNCQSQGIGINSTGSNPDPSAMLDVRATNMGMLVPRVALTGTTSPLPITSPAHGLLVFDTVTVSDVTPGFYYWDANETKWVRLVSGLGATGATGATGNNGTNGATGATGATGPTGAGMTKTTLSKSVVSEQTTVSASYITLQTTDLSSYGSSYLLGIGEFQADLDDNTCGSFAIGASVIVEVDISGSWPSYYTDALSMSVTCGYASYYNAKTLLVMVPAGATATVNLKFVESGGNGTTYTAKAKNIYYKIYIIQ